ncbi:zinc-binding dehydrogenase [Streptomyces sp. NPDC059786]|uniref:zinc-binding dehydrogenase n=1 Tax=Streptomyces sp. NPDC059786 TaxID=3346946 RepID=UPI003665C31D
MTGSNGSTARHCALPVPRGTDAAEAVALGVNAFVAEIALHRAGTAAGERVLVRGAGGGIGSLATQIASARGAEVTAVTSSAARGERLLELGAARIVDRTAVTVPDQTYDVIVDTVAGPDMRRYLKPLRAIRFPELTDDQSRRQWRAEDRPDEGIEFMLRMWATAPETVARTTSGVEEVLSRPPRTFAQRAVAHADAFRL